mgnify:FL=1
MTDSERIYYVLSENNCKFEGLTKEQILSAIEQAVNSGKIKDVDTGFITKIKEQNKNAGLMFWVGNQAEYNALESKRNNCLYIITDDRKNESIELIWLNLGELNDIADGAMQCVYESNDSISFDVNFTGDGQFKEFDLSFGDYKYDPTRDVVVASLAAAQEIPLATRCFFALTLRDVSYANGKYGVKLCICVISGLGNSTCPYLNVKYKLLRKSYGVS